MSGNVSNHIWVEDNTKPLGGYWARASGLSTGATLVTTAGAPAVLDTRLIRFDAVADMPADITSVANVLANIVQITGISSDARKLQFIWHAAGITGPDTQATQAFFGEVALGARIAVGFGDASESASALAYSDLTGGGTSTASDDPVFMVSRSHSFEEVHLPAAIERIDVVGIPNGLSATNFDTILPCFLEVRILG